METNEQLVRLCMAKKINTRSRNGVVFKLAKIINVNTNLRRGVIFLEQKFSPM
jgi:hypothetical protein